MSTYLDEVREALIAWDADRPRSTQAEVGWSEAMDCRAALGYRLAGEWAVDTPDLWRAVVGTLLHDGLAGVLRDAVMRRWETGELGDIPDDVFQGATEYRGLPGHPDHIDTDGKALREWKFPTVATCQSWQRSAEAFAGKRAQAHGYAAGLVDTGVLPEDCTVTVLAMPVDGTFADWWEWSEPFDRSVADEAAARVAEVRQLQADGESLPRDKHHAWCERFCEWFTLCRGDLTVPENELITDPETVALVERYGDVAAQLTPLTKEKDRIAREIRGQRGVTPGGYRISMTQPSGTKQVPDLDAVAADYERSGLELPVREVPTSTPALQVRRPKAQ